MKDQQQSPSMTLNASHVKQHLFSVHAKSEHNPQLFDVMLLSMLTGLRIQEVVNLRYRDLYPKSERETGDRNRFLFPETQGGADGE